MIRIKNMKNIPGRRKNMKQTPLGKEKHEKHIPGRRKNMKKNTPGRTKNMKNNIRIKPIKKHETSETIKSSP